MSPKIVTAAVDDAIANSTGDEAAAAPTPVATGKTKKLSDLKKSNNITLKWGTTDDKSLDRVETGPEQEVGATAPPPVKPKLKKLPGQRKPPTVTLKRAKKS